MSQIIKLPPQLANMISAGEVVERPLSVVKELVENSLDAQSSIIRISLSESGIRKIAVTDNGTGIEPDQMVMAFEPHATSKISTADDLFHITSLGFRGEALPSIASVALVSMTSSTTGLEGYHCSFRGGELLSQGPANMTRGTKVEVENLFFNTPARYKHLGSTSQELNYIVEYLTKCALSHPDVSFFLTNNDKNLFKTSGRNDIMEIIGEAYGPETINNLVSFNQKNGLYHIEGFTTKNSVFRSNKNSLAIILNGRVIRNSGLLYAITDAYKTILPLGKYPICVLSIRCDARLIDVNVHPSKLEVRLTDEFNLKTLITDSIRSALFSSTMIYEEHHDQSFKEVSEDPEKKSPDITEVLYDEPLIKASVSETVKADLKEEAADDLWKAFADAPLVNVAGAEKAPIMEQEAELLSKEPEKPEQYTQTEALKQPFYERLEYLGQYHETYLLLQDESDLYLIDQHAAMERVMYEKISSALKKPVTESYELLIPFTLSFSVAEVPLIVAKTEELKALGIVLDEFGPNAVVIREIPLWIPNGLENEFIYDIVNHIISNRETNRGMMYDSLAKTLACKKSIKALMHIDALEVRKLLQDLDQCRMPYTCPHGRPTMVKFTLYDIEKMFKRVV